MNKGRKRWTPPSRRGPKGPGPKVPTTLDEFARDVAAGVKGMADTGPAAKLDELEEAEADLRRTLGALKARGTAVSHEEFVLVAAIYTTIAILNAGLAWDSLRAARKVGT